MKMENMELKSQAFTYEEALDIVDDFEDLIGTDFGIPSLKDAEVEYVCIVPFNDADRHAFLASLKILRDQTAALAPYLDLPGYDVYLIGSANGNDILYPIRAYADIVHLNYRFPGQS